MLPSSTPWPRSASRVRTGDLLPASGAADVAASLVFGDAAPAVVLSQGGCAVVSGGLVATAGGCGVVSGETLQAAGGCAVVSGGVAAGGCGIVSGGWSLDRGGCAVVAGGWSVVAGGCEVSSGGVSAGGCGVVSGETELAAGGCEVSSGACVLASGGCAVATGGLSAGGCGVASGGRVATAGGCAVVSGQADPVLSQGGCAILSGGVSAGGCGVVSGGLDAVLTQGGCAVNSGAIYAPGELPAHVPAVWRVTVGGVEIDPVRIEVSHSEGDASWTCTLALADPTEYARFRAGDSTQPGTAFVVEMGTVVFTFLCDETQYQAGHGQPTQWTIRGLSPGHRQGGPWATAAPVSLPQMMARAAAASLLPGALAWHLPDWPIPQGRLEWDSTTPLDAARQIVEAAGGVLEGTPAGGWIARRLRGEGSHPLITGLDDLLTISRQTRNGAGWNRVRVMDRDPVPELGFAGTECGTQHSDKLEFEASQPDSRAGVVRGFASPWRPVQITTSQPGVVLVPDGSEYLDREETLVVQGGSASVSYPVASVQGVDWIGEALGPVVAGDYATDVRVTGASPCSVGQLTIRYRTRAVRYLLSAAAEVDQALLVMRDG
jgi:hypothetical protein